MVGLETWLSYNYNIFWVQVPTMFIGWLLCITLNNGSFVDFCWPLGLLLLAVQIQGPAGLLRTLLIKLPFIICALRFMLGWIFGRKHYKKEDSRWNLWREKWRKGEGLLSITSPNINFFFFYHAQSLTNVFIFSAPIILMTNNQSEDINYLEIFGFLLWIISFYLENVADLQLVAFKLNKEIRHGVLNTGLWRYSRHPNYFFEILVWTSYVIMSIPSCTEYFHYCMLLLVLMIGYYFLVHFTGVPMAEKSSLLRRGETYRKYMETTNMIFPWFK